MANSVDEANKKTEDFHKNNENGYTEEAKSLQKIKDYMIKQGGDYAKLGEKLNSSVDFDKIFGKGYFENLIQEVLLENKHSCEIVLKPSKELGKIRREKEEKKLTNVLNSMTDVQKQQLQIEQKQLDAFQQAPDTLPLEEED